MATKALRLVKAFKYPATAGEAAAAAPAEGYRLVAVVRSFTGPGWYRVEQGTTPGVAVMRCDCPAWGLHGGGCKHVGAVREWAVGMRQASPHEVVFQAMWAQRVADVKTSSRDVSQGDRVRPQCGMELAAVAEGAFVRGVDVWVRSVRGERVRGVTQAARHIRLYENGVAYPANLVMLQGGALRWVRASKVELVKPFTTPGGRVWVTIEGRRGAEDVEVAGEVIGATEDGKLVRVRVTMPGKRRATEMWVAVAQLTGRD